MPQPTYDNNPSTSPLTITLASLAHGATGYRQSTVVDNSTDRYFDVIIGGQITTGTSPTANNVIEVYAFGTWNAAGSTRFPGALGASDAAWTPTDYEWSLRSLETIVVGSTSDKAYEFGGVSLRRIMGYMPEEWGVVVANKSGVNLHATAGNHFIEFTGLN